MASAEQKWLTIVGLGENGIAGLGDEAKQAVAQAAYVFGGARHLALAKPLISGAAHAWPSPFSVEPVVAQRGEKVCVLASGDPFLHGVGATLARHVDVAEYRTIPAPSSFSLAAARLGWPLQDVDCISLHGHPIEQLRPHLQPGRRVLALTSDQDGPRQIAEMLAQTGFGSSKLNVLEALGGDSELIRMATAAGFSLENINPLNVLAIEVEAAPQARVIPRACGLPDSLFEHDGQLTKREVRAVTLSSLAPLAGQLLWDIGAGSGSIGIEWMLAHPAMRAVAIEADPERAERARANASACGVPGLVVKNGQAPDALSDLESPDAIFIGGGGTEPGVMDAALEALKPGGRLVANAVTLEMQALLLDQHQRLGGELIEIAIRRAASVGAMTTMRPALPITQWIWIKS